jgi:hypothetical protein
LSIEWEGHGRRYYPDQTLLNSAIPLQDDSPDERGRGTAKLIDFLVI